jgi:hypothetical protein
MIRFAIKTVFVLSVLAVSIPFFAGGSLCGYALLGFELGLDQRDFRIYNNFRDGLANDNMTPDSDFGGAHGAVLAIWKGVAEWGSGRMGDSPWGNGGANFDAVYVGEADKAGGYYDNIISSKHTNGGNTIAVTTSSANGWRIRFFEYPYVWNDGPESTPDLPDWMDLQGIAAHEFGHALGLDHTSDPAATMFAYLPGAGNWLRTIETDDVNGLHAIYGAASPVKPVIRNHSGGTQVGETLTLRGVNFSAANNEVWFTGAGANGEPVKVTGLASSGGGTQIDVVVPAGARNGNVAVKVDATGHDALSNCYPIEVDDGASGVPVPDLKINGGDAPLTVTPTDVVTVKASLHPNAEAGVVKECWIYVDYTVGLFSTKRYWRYPGSWSATPSPAYTGPLTEIVNHHIVSAKLPAGTWTFYFGVDEVDGYPSGTRLDVIEVISQ